MRNLLNKESSTIQRHNMVQYRYARARYNLAASRYELQEAQKAGKADEIYKKELQLADASSAYIGARLDMRMMDIKTSQEDETVVAALVAQLESAKMKKQRSRKRRQSRIQWPGSGTP